MSHLATIIVLLIALLLSYFFFNQFKYFDVFGIGKNKSMEALPAIASELGLRYIPASDKNSVGGIEGKYKTFALSISPDDPSVINLELNQELRVDISNHDPSDYESEGGMVSFNFSDDAINRFITVRYASERLSKSMSDSDELNQFLDQFIRRWKADLYRFELNNNILSVRFKHGMQGYVPAESIKPMIEDLVALAGILSSL